MNKLNFSDEKPSKYLLDRIITEAVIRYGVLNPFQLGADPTTLPRVGKPLRGSESKNHALKWYPYEK